MITELFKVYADNDLVKKTFTEEEEAISWAKKNYTNFNLVELRLVEGLIEVRLDGCDFGIYVEKEDDEHLVYLQGELLGRFPNKARRETVLCGVNKMLLILKEEEERYLNQFDEFDAARGEEEGPYGGAFRDQEDYENYRFGGISYLNSL